MTEIAVLGTGRMGSAMAGRLCAAGYQVTVWNRSLTRTAEAAAAGAKVAATPADAVAGADLVITMLTDGHAVETALFGEGRIKALPPDAALRGEIAAATPRPNAAPSDESTSAGTTLSDESIDVASRPAEMGSVEGAVAALRPGAVLVQMSTIGPAETMAIAERLPAGVDFVDAPVGGSVDAVAAGSLTILAGGTPTAMDRAEVVLRDLGTVRRCGPVGAGTSVKLMQNTAMLTALGALHDTLATATALGVDRSTALDLLAAGPLGGALRRAGSTTADFAVALAVKDLRLTYEETPDRPVVAATLRLLEAVPDQNADLAALIG